MVKKKNIIFIIKLITIILLVSLVIGVANMFYVKGAYYKDVYGEVEKMNSVPEHLTMVNVGTSHGLSCFRYSEDEKDRFNLALSGSDIYHNFATLEQFKDNFEPGCIIAFPTSYFSFCMPTDEPSQKRYYTFLDKEYLLGFSYETLINSKYLPVLRSGEYIIKDIIKDQEMDVGGMMMDDEAPVQEVPQKAEAQPSTAEKVFNKQKHNELVTHAKGRAVSWRSGHFVTGQSYIEKNIEILIEAVNWCRENDFKPLLVTTPIYSALNEQFTDEELRTNYFDNIDKVVKATGVPYLDLSHDSVLSNEPDYYGNSDHMNADGAAAFMEVYYNYLKEIGYTA